MFNVLRKLLLKVTMPNYVDNHGFVVRCYLMNVKLLTINRFLLEPLR